MKKKQQAETPAAHDANPPAHDDKLQLFERISDAFVALDKNWCYTYVNQKAGVIMRKDPEQMIGRHILAEFPGIEGQPYYLGFEKAMREQVYVYIEEYSSVNERWFEFHIYPSAEGISVFFREITDRKLAELNLQKANRLYNFISQVNQLIVRTKDQENLFREVCEIAVRLGKFKLAWIGLLDEKTGIVNPVAFAGEEDGYLTHIKKIHISLDHSGKGPTGSAIRNGEIVVSHDIENDPRMLAWCDEAMKRGYRSSIAVPVRRGGKVIGAFSLYAGEKHFFDTSEVALLEEATGDISFSLDVYENEKKRNVAESALRTSEIKLRRIFDSTRDILFMLETGEPESFRFISVNKQFLQSTGLNEEQVIGQSAASIIPSASWPMVLENYRKAIQTRNVVQWEDVSAYPSGEKTGIVTLTPVFDDTGHCNFLIGSVHDITDQVKAQAEIKQVSEQLRRLSAHLLAVRDEERKRIGREIHDELGQHLTAIKMDVAWIDKKIPADAAPIRDKLRNMITLLDSSHLSLRKILNELRMGILEHQGLEEALKWQVSLFTDNTGIPVSFRIEKPFELKDEAIASCLFRVFQESLTNITRYAHAKQVKALLRREPGMIWMEITDDGTGFDAAILNNPVSFGILGMRERVTALEGKFLLDTQPGKGTTIAVSIPYHE